MISCERCTYDLTGIAKGGAATVCPECGHAQYAMHFEAAPSLTRWRVGWLLTRHAMGWCSACAAVFVLLLLLDDAAPLELLLLCLSAGAVGAGFYGALGVSWSIAMGARPPGPARRSAWRRLAGLGLVLNLVVGIAFMAGAIGALVKVIN